MFSRPSFRGLLTNHCSYSVEGGAASRLGQCSHAFVRTLFAQGNAAGWVHQQVPRHSIFCFTLSLDCSRNFWRIFLRGARRTWPQMKTWLAAGAASAVALLRSCCCRFGLKRVNAVKNILHPSEPSLMRRKAFILRHEYTNL